MICQELVKIFSKTAVYFGIARIVSVLSLIIINIPFVFWKPQYKDVYVKTIEIPQHTPILRVIAV